MRQRETCKTTTFRTYPRIFCQSMLAEQRKKQRTTRLIKRNMLIAAFVWFPTENIPIKTTGNMNIGHPNVMKLMC
ncbi:Uncharacterised protein [Neisseria dentiae]|nr:Uncharacterised protein [Neisseria dentiae]